MTATAGNGANFNEDAQITALDDGTVVLAWHEARSDGASSVYAQRFGGTGTPQWAQRMQLPAELDSGQSAPAIAALKNGGFAVTWTANYGAANGGSAVRDSYGGIFGQRYDSSGQRLGGEFHVNTTTKGTQENDQILVHEDGSGCTVLWLSHGPKSIRFQSFASPDRPDSTPVPANSENILEITASFQNRKTEPGDWKAVALQDGGFGVVRHNGYGDVFVQSFHADGSARAAGATITTAQGGSFKADLNQLPDGRLVVT